jgi:SSS family transporter
MRLADYITIILFTVGILTAGTLFSKSGRSMKNFFSAGGAVPWPMAGLSLFMGFFSAGTFVVWGSIAYTAGWVAVTIQWTMCIAGLLVGLFIAGRWRKTGALTAAEYITSRLGLKTQKAYTILFLFVSLFTSGSFLYPVGKILEVSTGLSLSTCIILIGFVSILYVAAGGLRAVVVTDVLQFVILFAAVVIVIPLSFDRIGGVQEWIAAAPETFFELTGNEYTWGFMIAYGLYNMVFLGGNWAYVQRYTTVKSPSNARKVGFLFSAMYVFSPILWMLPPMIYRVVNPSLVGLSDEGAYLLMCKEVLPAGLLGLMIGGMIFATASSLNATLNISSAVFTNDIYKRLRPASSDPTLLKVARVSTIVFGLLAVIVALLIPSLGGVVNVVISIGALTGVPLYLPVIWSLFSKRQTGRSVLTVTLVSLAVNLFFKFVTPAFGLALSRAEEMILGVGFPFVCLVIYEIYAAYRGVQNPEYQKYNEEYVDGGNADTVQSIQDKLDNAFSIRVVGIGVALAGLTIGILGLIGPETITVVWITGSVLIAVGAAIFTEGKLLERKYVAGN